jgi:ferredoxin
MAGGGMRARRAGRRQGAGRGVRQRRREGSGRGAILDAGFGASVAEKPVATKTTPVAASPPASVSRVRRAAVVAHADRCTLCEACLDACPRGAITLRETPEVDAALCTGCGACENACPNDVFELAPSPPPRTAEAVDVRRR